MITHSDGALDSLWKALSYRQRTVAESLYRQQASLAKLGTSQALINSLRRQGLVQHHSPYLDNTAPKYELSDLGWAVLSRQNDSLEKRREEDSAASGNPPTADEQDLLFRQPMITGSGNGFVEIRQERNDDGPSDGRSIYLSPQQLDLLAQQLEAVRQQNRTLQVSRGEAS